MSLKFKKLTFSQHSPLHFSHSKIGHNIYLYIIYHVKKISQPRGLSFLGSSSTCYYEWYILIYFYYVNKGTNFWIQINMKPFSISLKIFILKKLGFLIFFSFLFFKFLRFRERRFLNYFSRVLKVQRKWIEFLSYILRFLKFRVRERFISWNRVTLAVNQLFCSFSLI